MGDDRAIAEENWTIVRIVPSQSLHANLLHLDLLAIHLRNEGRADLCVWFIVEPSAKIGRVEGGEVVLIKKSVSRPTEQA